MIQWLTHNLGVKIISLLLAVGLWYYALGEEGIEVTRVVPLKITVQNSQMSLLKISVTSVKVTFISPRASLAELASSEIKAVHEIKSDVNRAGDYAFRLEPREIKLNTPQIRVVRIEPELIQVTLDELIVQKLAVEPNFVGEPAFGYDLIKDKIELNPNAVLVEGPKGQLEKLKTIKTEKIDLVGRIRPFRRTVALELPSNVKILSEALIDVFAPIQMKLDEKSFTDIPIKVLRDPEGNVRTEIKPKAFSTVLKGPKAELEKLSRDKIVAYAEVTTLPPGEYDLPVHVVLPPDVSFKKEEPLSVQVLIQGKKK